MNISRRLITATVALGMGAHAAMAEDCAPNPVGVDVCAFALESQKMFAPSLPMQMSSTMTLSSVAAIGPVLQYVVTWEVTHEQLTRNSGETKEQLNARMTDYAARMSCGQETVAAFVRLGGRIHYIYKTMDGYPITTVVLDECPQR